MPQRQDRPRRDSRLPHRLRRDQRVFGVVVTFAPFYALIGCPASAWWAWGS